MSIRISIIIPTLGKRQILRETLSSCLRQDFPRDQYEILVVSNLENVQDSTKGLGPLRHLCTGELGVNRARNLGISAAKGEVLYFLDDDCVLPDADHLSRVSRIADESPDAMALGGSYQNPENAHWTVRGCNLMTRLWIGKVGETAHLPGGNLALRREVVERGFRFEERIVSGGDETELLRRLSDQGFRILFSHEIPVIHSSSKRIPDSIRRAWRQGAGAGRYRLRRSRKIEWAALFRLAFQDPGAFFFLCLHWTFMSAGTFSGNLVRRLIPENTDDTISKTSPAA